jgi:hypothetical protein
MRRLGIFIILVLLLVWTLPATGEILPHYKPEQLVLYSDLVVLGKQTSPSEIQIEKVLVGNWNKTTLSVPSLANYPLTYLFLEKKVPGLTRQIVVFVARQFGRVNVVANGVFRVTKKGPILGYFQPMNPGFYQLQAKPAFRALPDLLEAIAKGKADLPRIQQDRMQAVAKATQIDDFALKLHELQGITHVGDARIFDLISKQMERDPERANACIYFLQNHPDPACFLLLKGLYEKSNNITLLYSIGRQGTPAARPYLERLVEKKGNEERSRFAFAGLSALYEALARNGQQKEAAKVRDSIFRLYDRDNSLADFQPRLLSVIPEQGAIDRLEKMLARVRGDQSNRGPEIEQVLDELRARVQNAQMP